jgi:5'-3' exonuclease
METNLTKFINRNNSYNKERVLIIDGHNLLFRNVFSAEKLSGPESDFKTWKILMLDSIMSYVQQHKPTKLIYVQDDRNYWRKKIYPEYKAHRKAARSKMTVDFDIFFPIATEFMDNMQKALTNVYFLKVDKCEGDDLIAVLTKDVFKQDEVITITTDKDMLQLLKYPRYKQFDPAKKVFIKPLSFERDLDISILTGQRKDNIPGIVDRCGPVTANKMLNEGIEETFKCKIHDTEFKVDENGEYECQSCKNANDAREAFERNKILIDFDYIPPYIVSKIIDAYKGYEIKPYNGRLIYNFMFNSDIGGMIDRIQEFKNVLSGLK